MVLLTTYSKSWEPILQVGPNRQPELLDVFPYIKSTSDCYEFTNPGMYGCIQETKYITSLVGPWSNQDFIWISHVNKNLTLSETNSSPLKIGAP